jgi:hypothetical protein
MSDAFIKSEGTIFLRIKNHFFSLAFISWKCFVWKVLGSSVATNSPGDSHEKFKKWMTSLRYEPLDIFAELQILCSSFSFSLSLIELATQVISDASNLPADYLRA